MDDDYDYMPQYDWDCAWCGVTQYRSPAAMSDGLWACSGCAHAGPHDTSTCSTCEAESHIGEVNCGCEGRLHDPLCPNADVFGPWPERTPW